MFSVAETIDRYHGLSRKAQIVAFRKRHGLFKDRGTIDKLILRVYLNCAIHKI